MKFEVEGFNLDELIKVLYRKKIPLKNVVMSDNSHISFEADDRFEAKVKRYILNYKVKTNLSKIKQMPKFFLANLGIVLGVFFGSLFFIFASNFTWQIKVYGTDELSPNEILQVLEDNGVKVGKINLATREEIETILLNNYDRIAQVSVIKQGTAIIINLSEKLVYEDNSFEPIVAKYSGIITEVNIKTGTTNVKVGDYVNVGDVLVLPFNLNADGEKINVQPLAEIKAKIFVVGGCSLSEEEYVLQPTGKVTIEYKYSLFGFNIFSGKNKNSFAQFETKVYNENVSDLVPLKRQKVVYYELAVATVRHNLSAEEEGLKQKSYSLALEKLPSAYELIDEQTTTTLIDNTLRATTILTIVGIIN